MTLQFDPDLTDLEAYIQREFSEAIKFVGPEWVAWDDHTKRIIPNHAERLEKAPLSKGFWVFIGHSIFKTAEERFKNIREVAARVGDGQDIDGHVKQVLVMIAKEAMIASGQSRAQIREIADPVIFPKNSAKLEN